MSGTELLKIEGLSKEFPGIKVLDDINITFKSGEIHALMGENGAGKSTFMNILFGYHKADKDKLIWNGEKTDIYSPLYAQKIGIGMIHQENSLLPYLSVMDNIFLGHYPKKAGFVQKKEMQKKVRQLLSELEISDIKPTTMVENLSVAQKQLIEIVKALSIDPKLLLMDEPTAALTLMETNRLMRIIRKLKSNGVAIVYVSHRLEEVFEISDKISILRDGRLVKTCDKTDLTIDMAITLMVGRDLGEQMKRTEHNKTVSSDLVLEIKDFCKKGKFSNISFNAKKGEILGFGGLVGAGRSELMEAIVGYKPQDSGSLLLNGQTVNIKSPYHALKYKIALVPEERKVKGLFYCLSVAENINISNHKKMKKALLISKKLEKKAAMHYVDLLNIKTTNINKQVVNLSGGNQQKTILGRWLQTTPEILILDEPTHGIDVGAKAEIYRIIKDLSASGMTILLVSSELPELLMLSDRIVVMHNGTLTGIVEPNEFSQETIMKYATGQCRSF